MHQNQKSNIYKIGTAYYPDYVPYQSYDLSSYEEKKIPFKDRIVQDFERMQKIGIAEIRMGEFSWSTVEPKEGKYEPSIFLYALDEALKAKIDVIFCTPTATPPKWLVDRHPEILPNLPDGRKIKFGSRRHYDPCSDIYIDYSKKITAYYAKIFGAHEAVKMWQIDNELGHHGSSSLYTDSARKKFRSFLRGKYETIDKLNDSWFTCFWSQGYSDFDQIDLPYKNWADPNPHTLLDFRSFCTQIYREYQRAQSEIIKQNCPDTIITHNLISNFYELCPWEMTKDLDQVGFDHYQDFDYPTPVRSSTNFSLLGSLAKEHADKKFKILEQQPVQVNWQKINRRFPFDWLILWSAQSALHGSDTMDYFSWQRFYGGPEQYHDGILPHDIRNKSSNQEKTIIATNKMFMDIEERFGWSIFPDKEAKVLVIHNTKSLWSHRITSQSTHYDTTFQLDELTESLNSIGAGFHYKPSIPDFKEMSSYEMIILPGYAFELDTSERKNLLEYMKNGGKVLSLPRTMMKKKNNQMSALPLSLLDQKSFYYEEYGALGPEEEEHAETSDGKKISAHRWAEKIALVNKKNIETLAVFKTGLYKNSPAILKFIHEKGCHIHLAFCPKYPSEFSSFLLDFLSPSTCSRPLSSELEMIPLQSNQIGLLNFSNEVKKIELKTDLAKVVTYSLNDGLELHIHQIAEIKDRTFSVAERSFSIISPMNL